MLPTTVTSLPRLSVTPHSLIVRPSTTVALTCALRPDPRRAELVNLSDVQWKRDGRELETSRGHVTLIISDFDETTHSGDYQCSAEVAGVGRTVSGHATVHAAGILVQSLAILQYIDHITSISILFYDRMLSLDYATCRN